VILFARVAGIMRLGWSPILGPQGKTISEFRPESILTWLVIPNAQAAGPDILRKIVGRVQRYQDDRRRPRGDHGAV
jgi:hypothetical protein